MNYPKPFDAVVSHVRETVLFESIQATLEWDERTGLPSDAGEFRAQQITTLSGLIHHRRTDVELGKWLEELSLHEVAADSNSDFGATVRGLKRDFDRNRKLPAELVQSLSRATVLGQQAWSLARTKNDYASFLPHLKEILRLRREEASLLRVGSQPLYDTLLDQYEEQASSEQIRKVFGELRVSLVQLIRSVQGAPRKPDGASLSKAFDVGTQRQMSRWVAEQIGFQFSRGRLDETDHPFCTTLGPDDHRILARYQENSLSSGLFGTLHEAGHGMYEQGLRREWFGLPPGMAASLGVHESQSRLWENMIGRSRDFWHWCLPHTKKFFPNELAATRLETFYRDINRVEPSFIRVEADEVTYNLHILIRFELEQELIEGTLREEDLPAAWNERYANYLDIQPRNDSEGVLQDIHWSAGLVGYFPTYTLGNIYAAQLVQAANRDLGSLPELIRSGEFSSLLKWLRSNIHQFGRRYLPTSLIQNATKCEMSAQPLIEYLRTKLTEVYSL